MPCHQRGHSSEASQKRRTQRYPERPSFAPVFSFVVDLLVKMFSWNLSFFHIFKYLIFASVESPKSLGFRCVQNRSAAGQACRRIGVWGVGQTLIDRSCSADYA